MRASSSRTLAAAATDSAARVMPSDTLACDAAAACSFCFAARNSSRARAAAAATTSAAASSSAAVWLPARCASACGARGGGGELRRSRYTDSVKHTSALLPHLLRVALRAALPQVRQLTLHGRQLLLGALLGGAHGACDVVDVLPVAVQLRRDAFQRGAHRRQLALQPLRLCAGLDRCGRVRRLRRSGSLGVLLQGGRVCVSGCCSICRRAVRRRSVFAD